VVGHDLFDTFLTAFYGLTGNKLRAALTGLVSHWGSLGDCDAALGNGARAAVEAIFVFLGSETSRLAPNRN